MDLSGPSLNNQKLAPLDWLIGTIAVAPASGAGGWVTGTLDGLGFIMTAAPEMRDLAHRLLTYEADAGNGSERTESPTVRVYERLRYSLVEFVGVSGFQSLAMRALTLTKADAATPDGIRIAQNGSLEGLREIDPQSEIDMDRARDVGILLIAHLLGLLRMFLGEALTLSLLRNAWPGEVLDDGNAVNGRKA